MTTNTWLSEPAHIDKINDHIDVLYGDITPVDNFLRDHMKAAALRFASELGPEITNGQVLSKTVSSLEALKSIIDASAHKAWTSLGFNRVINDTNNLTAHTFFTTLVDDDEPLQYANNYIDPELSEEVAKQGVVTHIDITYPRSDRYGIPTEATEDGAREWLWSRGFAVTEDLVVIAVDDGGDGMASCEIVVHIPAELAEQLNDNTIVERPSA